jgi:hypothetical protein
VTNLESVGMLVRRAARTTTGLAVAILMLLTVSAAAAPAMPTASPLARVRFLQAVAGGGSARVEVVSATTGVRTSAGGESTFGEITPYAAVSSGAVRLELVAPRTHATATAQLIGGARYTVLATGSGASAALHLYRDGGATAGTAKLRVIHAAPELGTPDIALGGRPVAQGLSFGSTSGYMSVTPGSEQLAVMAPQGNRTVASTTVSLAAGTATTAVLIGTGGEPVRVVTAQDTTVTPGGPPETGLGGLTDGGGPRWLLIIAAMLAGGALAGAMHATARRRGQR